MYNNNKSTTIICNIPFLWKYSEHFMNNSYSKINFDITNILHTFIKKTAYAEIECSKIEIQIETCLNENNCC